MPQALRFVARVEFERTTVSYLLTVPREGWDVRTPITWEVPAHVPEYLASVTGCERRKLPGDPSVLVIGNVKGRQATLRCEWTTGEGEGKGALEVTAIGRSGSSFEQVLADLRAAFDAPPPTLDPDDVSEAIRELTIASPFVDIRAGNAVAGKVIAFSRTPKLRD